MVLLKLLGIVFVIIGIFIIKFFPDTKSYQFPQMTLTGIFIGVVLLALGILLIIYG